MAQSPHDKNDRLRGTIVTPLFILFNVLILLNAHFSVAAEAPNETISKLSMTDDSSQLGSESNSVAVNFAHRLLRNGVDNIEFMDFVFCGCLVLLGLELVNYCVKKSGYVVKSKIIPVRGKHLDDLSSLDLTYITLNKVATVPFVYFLVQFMYHEPNAPWCISKLSFSNTIIALPAIFLIYDFFYTLLHWGLHIQSVYGYIHKHHHRQKAPTRANVDAVNVHPVEFFLGEYNHMFAVYIFTNLLGFEFHIVGLVLFLVIGATLAGLNHTRFDSTIEVRGVTLYDSKWHDVHHRIPQSNYGQYINFWDLVFGSFRAYNPKDRVNPKAQLDPNTGKSFEYKKKV